MPIDLTNDSDDEMEVKPRNIYKRTYSNLSSGPAQSSVNIESANPRDAIPPSSFE